MYSTHSLRSKFTDVRAKFWAEVILSRMSLRGATRERRSNPLRLSRESFRHARRGLLRRAKALLAMTLH